MVCGQASLEEDAGLGDRCVVALDVGLPASRSASARSAPSTRRGSTDTCTTAASRTPAVNTSGPFIGNGEMDEPEALGALGVAARQRACRLAGWGGVFNDQALAAAIIDSVVHHADVLTLKGASFRLRNR